MVKQTFINISRTGSILQISGNSSTATGSGRSFPIHNSDFNIEAECNSPDCAVHIISKFCREFSEGFEAPDLNKLSFKIKTRFLRKSDVENFLEQNNVLVKSLI